MTYRAGIVLKGRGGAFRLEEGAVRIVRGRTSWQVPLGAVDAVEHGDGWVGLRVVDGDAVDDFRVSGNATAVRAFREELDRARAEAGPAPSGAAPAVSVTVRPRTLRLPRPWAWGLSGACGYALYLVLLFTTHTPEQMALVVPAVITGPFGVGITVLVVICARDPWILWRRGITVPGEVVRYSSQKKQMAMNPDYRFTTVEGVTLTQRSDSMVLTRWSDPHVDVVYDPQDPTRVRGGRGVAHLVLTAFLALMGAALFTPPLVVFAGALGRLLSW
ncbi:DUF3592 domain-containing protein [Streptomyces sp. NPDC059247]|uniref:DUF3592 domain-containing protein n=1 Tax=Streptomyces sp. NPDC059247 TaxID=3346790 RepID=UPI0036BD2AED